MKIKLAKDQFQYYSSAFKNIAEGIILGSLAAYFLPEVFQMKESISIFRFILFFFIGILLLIFGGIISIRGKR